MKFQCHRIIFQLDLYDLLCSLLTIFKRSGSRLLTTRRDACIQQNLLKCVLDFLLNFAESSIRILNGERQKNLLEIGFCSLCVLTRNDFGHAEQVFFTMWNCRFFEPCILSSHFPFVFSSTVNEC